MITLDEALHIALQEAYQTESEVVDLQDSLNRILARDIVTDIDIPPFRKSAVDGFACRQADLSLEANHQDAPMGLADKNLLHIIETIHAGKNPEKKIAPHQCARIMTGAMVPDGADRVVMVEDTELISEDIVRITGSGKDINICQQGEDLHQGAMALKKGILIRPQEIAILASVGASNVQVYELPSIAVISTGDELVEPHLVPAPSQIRNSNGYQIMAQLRAINLEPDYSGIVPDDECRLTEMISDAMKDHSIVILTGGVSVGEYDFVPAVFSKLRAKVLFQKIAIQPGRPTVFARKEGQFLFGLPGNPVSSFVLCEMLVKPFLLRMMGATSLPGWIRLPMGQDYSRKRSIRQILIPVMIKDGAVFPVEYHGSAHIHSYSSANGILSVPPGITDIKTGTLVHVRSL